MRKEKQTTLNQAFSVQNNTSNEAQEAPLSHSSEEPINPDLGTDELSTQQGFSIRTSYDTNATENLFFLSGYPLSPTKKNALLHYGCYGSEDGWQSYDVGHHPYLYRRGYSIFQNILNESEEDQKHDDLFIKLQMLAGGGVGVAGTVGGASGSVLTVEEGALLAATGFTNMARNYLWPKAAKTTPELMGDIVTLHQKAASKTLRAAANTIDYINIFEEKSMNAHKLRGHAQSIHRKGLARRRKIKKDHNNAIGRDIFATRVTAAFLGAAVPIHFPQIALGYGQAMEKIQENSLPLTEAVSAFTSNGHFMGASIVSASYGLFAWHKLRELPRLKEAMKNNPLINAADWNNEMRHKTIGYLARGENMKQTVFVALPMLGFTYKGIAYVQEALHMHDWNATYNDLFEKGAELSASGAMDYLSQIDWSNSYSVAASASFAAAGVLFAGSGLYELAEAYKEPTKRFYDKNIVLPCQIAFNELNFVEKRRLAQEEAKASEQEVSEIVLASLQPDKNILNTRFGHYATITPEQKMYYDMTPEEVLEQAFPDFGETDGDTDNDLEIEVEPA